MTKMTSKGHNWFTKYEQNVSLFVCLRFVPTQASRHAAPSLSLNLVLKISHCIEIYRNIIWLKDSLDKVANETREKQDKLVY